MLSRIEWSPADLRNPLVTYPSDENAIEAVQQLCSQPPTPLPSIRPIVFPSIFLPIFPFPGRQWGHLWGIFIHPSPPQSPNFIFGEFLTKSGGGHVFIFFCGRRVSCLIKTEINEVSLRITKKFWYFAPTLQKKILFMWFVSFLKNSYKRPPELNNYDNCCLHQLSSHMYVVVFVEPVQQCYGGGDFLYSGENFPRGMSLCMGTFSFGEGLTWWLVSRKLPYRSVRVQKNTTKRKVKTPIIAKFFGSVQHKLRTK